MEDSTMDIIGILLASILMFIVPLFLIADRSDDISQLVAQTATAEFINEAIREGQITADNYQRFVSTLYSSGNTFDIDQVEEKIGLSTVNRENNRVGKLILKQGDQISVTVRNSSRTLSQSLKNIYYNITGDDVHIIVAASSGTVAINGSTGTM